MSLIEKGHRWRSEPDPKEISHEDLGVSGPEKRAWEEMAKPTMKARTNSTVKILKTTSAVRVFIS